ncbi:MAG: hypothetical protein HC902_10925 [Calothrix sp. SM1_5_4]|nr:hypothetical protein [Calothrix sp. SM1_5_4]
MPREDRIFAGQREIVMFPRKHWLFRQFARRPGFPFAHSFLRAAWEREFEVDLSLNYLATEIHYINSTLAKALNRPKLRIITTSEMRSSSEDRTYLIHPEHINVVTISDEN